MEIFNFMRREMGMTIQQFIRENREEIDELILSACHNAPLSDYQRELWILNDQSLYDWAREEGVDI